MFRRDNCVAGGASWGSYPTHLSDREPALLQLKYLMVTQLVGTCLHIISMKQQDHPGGLVPPTCQIQSQLLCSWNIQWIFDVRSTGWHMFRSDNCVAGRASWGSYPTHQSDQEPASSQLKYIMLTQLVSTCLHIISMKQQDHPGGLVPPIWQIQNQLHRIWNIWCWLSWLSDV